MEVALFILTLNLANMRFRLFVSIFLLAVVLGVSSAPLEDDDNEHQPSKSRVTLHAYSSGCEKMNFITLQINCAWTTIAPWFDGDRENL